MNLSTVIVIGLGVFMLWTTVSSQEKSCKALMSDMTKQQMAMMSKCAKGMKFKNAKDKAAKSTCIMRCVMQDVGMLNDQGKTDRGTMEKLVEKFFTSERDRIHVMGVLTPCAEKHASAMDPQEEFCKSYDPFIKCLMGSMMNHNHGKWILTQNFQ